MTEPRWWKVMAFCRRGLLSIPERLGSWLKPSLKTESVKAIFTKARTLHGVERDRYLQNACRNDDVKRSRVEKLLANDKQENDHPWLQIFTRPEAPKFNSGDRIDGYEIIDLLGRGGMGEVYAAHDFQLNRKVALKFLPREMARNPAWIDRLQREARAASFLKHPNIVTIHALGEYEGQHYIVSEYVDGKSLRKFVGNLSAEQAIDFAREIGIALEFAHSKGIIHRDVKPENIMVTAEGQIKILDFGLAKRVSLEKESQQDDPAGGGTDALTNPRSGTPAYMSPEQARGEVLDSRTDIWSWGLVLYEMLTGARPFLRAFSEEANEQVPAPASRDRRLNRVVMKALCRETEKRYHSMKAAVADLEKTKSPFSLRRIGIAAALLVLAAIAVYLSTRPAPPIKIKPAPPVNTIGDVSHVAMQPGEESFVYSTENAGRRELRRHWLKGEGEDVEIHHLSSGTYSGLNFSKDGKSIFYTYEQDQIGNVYELPLDTKEPKLILKDVDSPVSPSPDGNSVAFIRAVQGTNYSFLNIQNIKDPNHASPREILPISPPVYFFRAPAWSPDGNEVLYGTWGIEQKMGTVNIHTRQATAQQVLFYQKGKPAWMGKGRGIAVAGAIGNSDHWILQVFPPKYTYSILSTDGDYREVDMVPGSQEMVAVQTNRMVSPWIVSLNAPDKPYRVPIAPGKFSGLGQAADGRLLTLLNASDKQQLRFIDVQTGVSHDQANDSYYENYLAVSPDLHYLIYAANRDPDGTFRLWLTDLSNLDAPPVRLTKGATKPESQPAVSPDGKWVVYTALEDGAQTLWKVRIGDNYRVSITTNPSKNAAISPDGQKIACEYLEDKKWKTVILSWDTGKKVRSLPFEFPFLWSRDGKYLIYVDNKDGASNLWKFFVDSGQSEQMTHFNQDRIFELALSPDGQSVAFLRGAISSKAVLFELSK